MTADTVLNVASISKTFTNAAVLQLWEDGRIDLDDDVNRYLPFRLVHPRHPGTAITFRHLLTHTASIGDGEAYDSSYACGDPAVSLGDWIEGYLVAGGKYYDAEESFLDAEPGETYSYSNVGFGLLGFLVEHISGDNLREGEEGHGHVGSEPDALDMEVARCHERIARHSRRCSARITRASSSSRWSWPSRWSTP